MAGSCVSQPKIDNCFVVLCQNERCYTLLSFINKKTLLNQKPCQWSWMCSAQTCFHEKQAHRDIRFLMLQWTESWPILNTTDPTTYIQCFNHPSCVFKSPSSKGNLWNTTVWHISISYKRIFLTSPKTTSRVSMATRQLSRFLKASISTNRCGWGNLRAHLFGWCFCCHSFQNHENICALVQFDQ